MASRTMESAGGGTEGAPVDGKTGKAPALARAPAKAIVLFSDGTGNSSGKLFKTNVWRMYEAVDLGPPQDGGRKQIAFYDDGVGTSGFKPLAILGGVFGVGLRRNVQDIYRYVCRNYQPAEGQQPGQIGVDGGDLIYGFGFSRGAFTMRIAIAMIARMGLVVTRDEEELDRRVKEAWRLFRTRYRPRSPWAPANLWRRFAIGEAKAKEAEGKAIDAERSRNLHPIIQFVGVWDTVGAYGGPISEITEAIDNWIVRLSMPNYQLADAVRRARHALALDDERDAFHPLLWDEVYEQEAIAEAKKGAKPEWIDKHRLEQVWFTGMHADVGGGYPDESLSYVSFLWMMEEAKKAGLRPSPVMIQRFQALANSAGPIHDSRVGVGSYYRYQPRRIDVWMEPLHPELVTRRHPDRKRGLIRVARVHESVAARIASGTDRYAPLSLPAAIEVVPPQKMGENAPPDSSRRVPLVPEELCDRFEDETRGKARVEAMRAVWAQVERRRRSYFASLILTLALMSMPVWDDWLPTPPVLASGHGLTGQVIAGLSAFLPGFLAGLVESWAANPFPVLALVVLLILSNGSASRRERRLRDETRRIWDDNLGLDPPLYSPVELVSPPEPPTPAIDESPVPTADQRRRRFIRWRIVPGLILVLAIAILAWLALILATRLSLAVLERGTAFCPASPAATPTERADFAFATAEPCRPAGLRVEKGRRYLVQMEVEHPWFDLTHPADPRGLKAGDIGFLGYFAAPLRRAAGARYLQPVVRISGGVSGPVLQPLELQQRGTPPGLWRGKFTAGRSGDVSLFANDAVLIDDVLRLYRNNRGTARVTIVSFPGTPDAQDGTSPELASDGIGG